MNLQLPIAPELPAQELDNAQVLLNLDEDRPSFRPLFTDLLKDDPP